MVTIDQRILIPAPIDQVWNTLTDAASLSRWDQNTKQVIVLTQYPGGVGSRRRCVDAHGHSRVEEITAWLVPLGYEYKTIEGPYQQYTGRLRLQALPEGTQVQWTVTYRLRGILGGIRDQFGYRRNLRSEMADSLRTLRRQIEATGIRFDPNQHAKVAMQSDPGFEARRARAMDASRPDDSTRIATTAKTLPYTAPINTDDLDLPPIEAVQQAAESYAAPVNFASPPSPVTISEPPIAEDDTRQNAARRAATSLEPPEPPIAHLDSDDTPRPMRRSNLTTAALDASTIIARRESPIPVNVIPPPPPPVPINQPLADIPLPDADETGEASVWDIFGVVPPGQRPRVELDALITDLRTPPPSPVISVERAFDRPTPKARPALPPIPEIPVEPPIESTQSIEGRSVPQSAKASVRVRPTEAPTHAKSSVRVRRF